MNVRGFTTIFTLLSLLVLQAQFAYAECRVNARLDCVDQFGHTSIPPAWPPRSVVARGALLNSDDVQKSHSGCLLFTTLLQHECALKKPLQAIYTDPRFGVPSEIFAAEVGSALIENVSALPPAFQHYFSRDSKSDARLDSIGAAIRLGAEVVTAVESFLELTNNDTVLQFPASCAVPSDFEVCGVSGTCRAGKDPGVGDAIRLSKVGSMGRHPTQLCSEAETLRRVFRAIEHMYEESRVDAAIQLRLGPQNRSNFKAFSKMPLLNQVDGWIQGLAIEKYGGQTGKKIVAPGICLPTANAMMALALKKEVPGSRLGNRFDTVEPAGVANVRAVNTDPNSNVKLRYNHYAVHIDEMLRAGGLRWRYPTKFSDYTNFFYRNAQLTASWVPVHIDRQPVSGPKLGGHFIFFEEDYRNSVPVQKLVEENFKSWIANGTAFTLALQSSHSQPPRGSDPQIVGHAVATQGYSDSKLIVHDPWKVVSHLKFADYQFPDKGKIVDSVPDPSYPECIRGLPARCKKAARSCLDAINSINTNSVGKVNIAGCDYRGGPVPSLATLVSECKKKTTCQKTIDIVIPDGRYRMLNHVGSDAGYVGIELSKGSKKLSKGSKTAAYVTSYMTADPWPVVLTKDEFRERHSSDEIVRTGGSAGGCSALTQGEVVVDGKRYLFHNPLPLVKSGIDQVTSSTPITVGCVNLHQIPARGSPSPQATILFGTMSVTCSNNELNVTSNQCQAFPAKRACQVTGGSGYQHPISKPLGLSFFYEYGQCEVDQCRRGFTRNDSTKTCECVFTDALTGARHAGAVTPTGECSYAAFVCPTGSVMNAASNESAPSCVTPSQEIGGSSVTTPDLYRDSKNRRLIDFADKNSLYRFNAQGQVEWSRCKGPHRIPVTSATGDITCQLTPEGLAAECVFTDALTGARHPGALTPKGECSYAAFVCPTGSVKNAASNESSPSCVTPSKEIGGSSVTTPDLYRDSKNRRLIDFADKNSLYRFNAQGQVEWSRCKSPHRKPVTSATGDITCQPTPEDLAASAQWEIERGRCNNPFHGPVTSPSGDITCQPTSEYLKAVDLTLKLSSGRRPDGSCADGFLLDYEGRFCVAALTSCQLHDGGWGMMTYDPDAPRRCRFMGCHDGSTPRSVIGNINGIQDKEYLCGTFPSVQAVSDGFGGSRFARVVAGAPQFLPGSVDRSSEPPITKAQLLEYSSRRNVATDLDCSRETEPTARGVCRLLAKVTLGQISNDDTAVAAASIDSWRMSQSVPLATFNCGGPDTVELPNGECLDNWIEKRKTLGDCVIPNGKGTFVRGQGCFVDSCMPGFAANPSKRACLDLSRGCYRRDFPLSEAYLAQLPDGVGGGETCLIRSCPANFTYLDEFAAAIDERFHSSLTINRSYADYCLHSTSQSGPLTLKGFQDLKSAGFPGLPLRPGLPCGGGEDMSMIESGRVHVGGSCLPIRCRPDAAIGASGTCELYKTKIQWKTGESYSKYVLQVGRDMLKSPRLFLLNKWATLRPPDANPVPPSLCIFDMGSIDPLIMTALGFQKDVIPESVRAQMGVGIRDSYFHLQGFNKQWTQCRPPDRNDIVVEVANTSRGILGLGQITLSNYGDLFLHTCDQYDAVVSKDRRSCLRPPSMYVDPRVMRGGYITRTRPDSDDAIDHDLIESKTGRVVDISSRDEVERYISQALEADLTYNLSLGPPPFPILAPSVVCPRNSFPAGKTCVSNTRSCGTIAHGTYTETWHDGKLGPCIVRCDKNYHEEEGSCVSDTRACATPSGAVGTQRYNRWHSVWGACAGNNT